MGVGGVISLMHRTPTGVGEIGQRILSQEYARGDRPVTASAIEVARLEPPRARERRLSKPRGKGHGLELLDRPIWRLEVI
jgi:hypothetical protein